MFLFLLSVCLAARRRSFPILTVWALTPCVLNGVDVVAVDPHRDCAFIKVGLRLIMHNGRQATIQHIIIEHVVCPTAFNGSVFYIFPSERFVFNFLTLLELCDYISDYHFQNKGDTFIVNLKASIN